MTFGTAIFLVALMLVGVSLMSRGWKEGGVVGGLAIAAGFFMLLGGSVTGLTIV
ncbi:MAG TPA: hypothetical protein VI407_00760 [Erythrobacter sp.]